MTLAGAVFPDAVRGIHALIDGVQMLGLTIHPVRYLPADVFEARGDSTVVVHVQRDTTTTGDIDRVEEVRITVYGPDPIDAADISEAILSLICGELVETPRTEDAAPFFFDTIKQRTGPSPLDYPGATVFPVVTTVAARARPMN